MSQTGPTAEAAPPAAKGAGSPRSRVRSALSALNPLDLLFGPIFQKEVRSAGRKRSGYIGRGLYALALLLVVGIVFWAMWSNFHETSSVQRLQNLQELAPGLAVAIIWFQFIMLALTGPNLTAPAIADERRTGTLSALLTTPMTAGQIIGGKLSGKLVHVVILTLLGAPILLGIRIFGGLDAPFILEAIAVSIATAVLGASLGLLFSIWNQKATGASVFALLTLALFEGWIPVIDGMLYSWFSPGYTFHEETFAACSPATLLYMTRSALVGYSAPELSIPLSSSFTLSIPMWLGNVTYTLALALFVSVLSGAILRRVMVREGARDAGATVAKRRPAKARRKAAPAASPVADLPAPDAPPTDRPAADVVPIPEPEEVFGRERTVGDNPVLWREVRQPTFGSRRRFVIAALVALAGLLFLYINFGIEGNEGLHGSLAVIGAIAVMLQSVFMTTGGFVGEREGRTWDVLLTTPLSAGEITLGKLAGSLRSQWFLPGVVLAHFGLTALLGDIHPVILLQLVLIFAGPILLFTATGQLLSLLFKKSTPASVCNLILALAFWLLPWLILALVAYVMESSTSGYSWRTALDRAADTLGAFNPVATAVSAYEPAMQHWRHHTGARLHYELVSSGEISLSEFNLILVGVFAAYTTAAGAVLWLTIGAFRRWSGRVS